MSEVIISTASRIKPQNPDFSGAQFVDNPPPDNGERPLSSQTSELYSFFGLDAPMSSMTIANEAAPTTVDTNQIAPAQQEPEVFTREQGIQQLTEYLTIAQTDLNKLNPAEVQAHILKTLAGRDIVTVQQTDPELYDLLVKFKDVVEKAQQQKTKQNLALLTDSVDGISSGDIMSSEPLLLDQGTVMGEPNRVEATEPGAQPAVQAEVAGAAGNMLAEFVQRHAAIAILALCISDHAFGTRNALFMGREIGRLGTKFLMTKLGVSEERFTEMTQQQDVVTREYLRSVTTEQFLKTLGTLPAKERFLFLKGMDRAQRQRLFAGEQFGDHWRSHQLTTDQMTELRALTKDFSDGEKSILEMSQSQLQA